MTGGDQTPVHLHSWFIEPIRHPSSKLHSARVRVWGLSQPASKRWWRSSSIISATSPTRLTTRFGTVVILNGPLCELYAKRVNMSDDCIQRFRNGFPTAWKSQLTDAFIALRRSARLGDIALRRATVPILRKPYADGGSRDARRVRKRVRFDVQLRPLDDSRTPRKRARSSLVATHSHVCQQTNGNDSRRVLRPRAAPSARPTSRAADQQARYEKRTGDTSRAHLQEPLKSVRLRTASPVKKGTRRQSTASNSSTKLHEATGMSERKAPATQVKTNSRIVQKKRVSDTRIAVPIEQSAEILRARGRKRFSFVANDPSDKENCHLGVNVVPEKSVRPRKVLAAAADLKLDNMGGVRGARSELGMGVQRRKSVSERGSDGEQRRSVSEPPRSKKNSVEKGNSAPRRSQRLRDMASKIQRYPDDKTESPRQMLTNSERTKAQTRAKLLVARVDVVPSKKRVRSKDKQSSMQRRRMRTKEATSKETINIPDTIPIKQRRTTRTMSMGSHDSNSSMQKGITHTKDAHRPKEQKPAPGKRLRSTCSLQSIEKADLNEKPTELRRSSRLRARPSSYAVIEDSSQLVTNTTGSRLDATSGNRRKYEQDKRFSHTVSKKATRPERKSSVTFADTQARETRLRKKVSFEKQVGQPVPAADNLSISEEEWTQKQREEFEAQRNRVPANAPRYWESIAAGVEGKTAEQCLQLWESTWCSPVASKRKQVVSFTPGIAVEPAEKKPKLSTPQAVRNVQKGSKTKRGRNTAKYRTAVRQLADTVARDTEDDALEPEIRTPVGSCKLSGGLFGLPDLQDGTPGTEVRQKRRNAEQGGERATPEILKRGKSFGLREADQYVSLFRQRLGKAPIAALPKQEKPSVNRQVGRKAPLSITRAPTPHVASEDLSLSNIQDSEDSETSDDGDLFF